MVKGITFVSTNRLNIMQTIKNTTGTKAVNITTDANGTVHALYVQIYKGSEEVIQGKSFANIKNAEKWANKMIA